MTGKVLVVDDLLPNVKLLEAKLSNEYYNVAVAMNGQEGIDKAREFAPDIILLDVMMPEMDGFEACRRLKADPQLSHIPVVMVTALSEINDRVKGLEAGADDFITKPINEVHLLARVRSLVRVKVMLDELRMRDKTALEIGLISSDIAAAGDSPSRILVIDDDVVQSRNIQQHLEKLKHQVTLTGPKDALDIVAKGDYELIIVNTLMIDTDGLRLCAQIRSQEKLRQIPILILIDEDERETLIKGLEMGINDYIVSPIDSNELVARVRTQVRRKKYQDALRSGVEQSLNMAVVDSLTKLYNRRYLDTHLKNIVEQALANAGELSVMALDIDHFKQVNDGEGLGHHIGDEVLQQVADRIRNSIRNTDLATRPGGEEFVVVMPGTNLAAALEVAERIRSVMADMPFDISARDGKLNCTISIGVAALEQGADSAEKLLKRADEALYKAKHEGRNRVISAGNIAA